MFDKGCITVKASLEKKEAPQKAKMMLGRKYNVYPVIMMAEGAYYPNTDAYDEPVSLYFDGEDLKKSVPSWNGRPVSLNHPEGQVTCNAPENFDSQWLGHVFNARYSDEDRKLRADLWLDAERGAEISRRVKRGDNLDVSIGAFGDIVSDSGVSRGIVYNDRMINISGDHLAVLPDSIGACSWKDGCGIRAKAFIGCEMEKGQVKKTKEFEKTFMLRSSARKPSFSGVEKTSWEDVSKTFSSYLMGYYRSKGEKPPAGTLSVKNATPDAKKWIASKTLLGDAVAETEKDLIFFPVVNPSTDKLNEGALKAVLSGRGSQANLPAETLKSARTKAKNLLDMHFNEKSSASAENKDQKGGVMQETKKEAKVFNKDEWLASAPKDVQNTIKAALSEAKRSFDENVDKIVSCEASGFERENFDLTKGVDMSAIMLVKKIADLSCKYNRATEEIECLKKAECSGKSKSSRAVNYGVRAMGEADVKEYKTYAEVKDIDWSN